MGRLLPIHQLSSQVAHHLTVSFHCHTPATTLWCCGPIITDNYIIQLFPHHYFTLSIPSHGIANYCIVGFSARAVSRKRPIYFILSIQQILFSAHYKKVPQPLEWVSCTDLQLPRSENHTVIFAVGILGKQARKLQDAQAEKLKRSHAIKLTSWQIDKMKIYKLSDWQVKRGQDDKMTRW